MNIFGFVATKLVNTTLREQENNIRKWMTYAGQLQEEVDRLNGVILDMHTKNQAQAQVKRKYTKSGKYAKKAVTKKSK